MADTPQVFPLHWPKHKPRTLHSNRKTGRFRKNGAYITVAAAQTRLEGELTRLGATSPILSSSIPRRMDGGLWSERPVDNDHGVALYFHIHGKPYALACDAYYHVEDNIAALAAHIEATRAIERHGVATAVEALHAFQALPAPPDLKPKRPWWEVFGVMRDLADRETIEGLYRIKAAKAHPDKGGTHEAMAELSEAKAEALKEVAR